MKIIFYIDTVNIGGAQRVIANLANTFAKSNNEVILVNSFSTSNKYEILSSVKRYYLDTNKRKNSNFFIRNFVRLTRLRKILILEKPEIIVAFLPEPTSRAIISSVGLTTKTIVSVRNDPYKAYRGLIGWFKGQLLLPFADGCVFQTEEAKNYFSKKLQDKSTIILNPVSDKFYNIEYNGVRKNIVATGRLEKQKNHELLIRAFSSIASKVEDNLIIYGEGTERVKLEKLISDLGMSERIFLPGSIDNVSETIKSAKLYVLSSDYEGMPNSLMEAMALGLPCISTNCPCGGPKSIIKNNENGILVDVNNQNQLSNIMIKLIKDKNKRNELGKKAKIAALNFKPEVIYKKWKDYMEKIIKS